MNVRYFCTFFDVRIPWGSGCALNLGCPPCDEPKPWSLSWACRKQWSKSLRNRFVGGKGMRNDEKGNVAGNWSSQLRKSSLTRHTTHDMIHGLQGFSEHLHDEAHEALLARRTKRMTKVGQLLTASESFLDFFWCFLYRTEQGMIFLAILLGKLARCHFQFRTLCV